MYRTTAVGGPVIEPVPVASVGERYASLVTGFDRAGRANRVAVKSSVAEYHRSIDSAFAAVLATHRATEAKIVEDLIEENRLLATKLSEKTDE